VPAAQANVELVESAEFHVLNMYYLALYSITALKSDQVWWSKADPNGSAAATASLGLTVGALSLVRSCS
jgi:hypothetical protein